jgi:hypothetical protein
MVDGMTGIKMHLDINESLNPVANHLDPTFLLLVVQNSELTLLLPIIQRTDGYLGGSISGEYATLRLVLTTIKMATMIATPSTQSTAGSPSGRGVPKSWKSPKANEITAAIDSKIYAVPKNGIRKERKGQKVK